MPNIIVPIKEAGTIQLISSESLVANVKPAPVYRRNINPKTQERVE